MLVNVNLLQRCRGRLGEITWPGSAAHYRDWQRRKRRETETAETPGSSEKDLQKECDHVCPLPLPLLNACVAFLFPLAAVERVVRQIFSLASQQRGPEALCGSSKHSLEAIRWGKKELWRKVSESLIRERERSREEPKEQGESGECKKTHYHEMEKSRVSGLGWDGFREKSHRRCRWKAVDVLEMEMVDLIPSSCGF